MSIKNKIFVYLGITMTLLYGVIGVGVYSLFSTFRQNEFKDILSEKALNMVLLLIDQEKDNNLLKLIDEKTIHKLPNEKTLIFDKNFHLVFSSSGVTDVSWAQQDLRYIRVHKTLFRQRGEDEMYGFAYHSSAHDYYALVSAYDSNGERNLEYLVVLLIGSYVLYIAAVWIISFYIVEKELKPLSLLLQKIKDINEKSMNTRLEIAREKQNEIILISHEFNHMMDRISEAYQKQKDFTSNASHELRLPLARISVLLENWMNAREEKDTSGLKPIFRNLDQLNELINSLLILSRVDNQINTKEVAELDSVLYSAIEKVRQYFPDFKMNLDIQATVKNFSVKGNAALLEIAIHNLVKNAVTYSDNQVVEVSIEQDERILLSIRNTGQTLTDDEQKKLFQPFMRGENGKHERGIGLGLRIVHRILTSYHHTIEYRAEQNLNVFNVRFDS